METLSALLAFCAGNLPVTGEFHIAEENPSKDFIIWLPEKQEQNRWSFDLNSSRSSDAYMRY